MPFQVAFLGFSDFERNTLASTFRLALNRSPAYGQVYTVTDADYLVVDADHAPSVALVLATERLDETVFVGAQAPAGSRAWMMRPIDTLQIMRELDRLVGGPVAEVPAAPVAAPEAPRSKVELAAERMSAAAPPPPTPLRTEPPLSLTSQVWPPMPRVADLAPPAAPVAPPRPPQPLPTPHALIVDDSEVARRFLQSKLTKWRLIVDQAASSAEALEKMAGRAPDLVFLDVELGAESEMNGLELCRHIKRSPEFLHAAVVMVSAHSSEMDRVRGSLVGCDAYLAKPLDEVELQRVLMRQGVKAQKDAGAGVGTTPA
ncbi:MAG: response regulator [Rubrivivax sp.]|nr:response regulator [Rubrivivax sp.]